MTISGYHICDKKNTICGKNVNFFKIKEASNNTNEAYCSL